MQCERKPITKCLENSQNENGFPGLSRSPENHPVFPNCQEKIDYEPLSPSSSTASFSSPIATSPRSPSAIHATEAHLSIISPENLQFKLNPPTLGLSSLSMDYIYEIATRLLFLTVDWTRNIQAFRSLDSADQLVLLQSSWSDLFMLGVSQCSSSFPLSPLLTLAAVHMERSECDEEHKPLLTKDQKVLEKVLSVKELLLSLEKLELDLVEYAFFKTIILFNPGKSGFHFQWCLNIFSIFFFFFFFYFFFFLFLFFFFFFIFSGV